MTLKEIEQWADSLGYGAATRMGVFRLPAGQRLWIVKGDTLRVETGEYGVVLTRPDLWEADDGFVRAVLAAGGTIRWAEENDTARRYAAVDIDGRLLEVGPLETACRLRVYAARGAEYPHDVVLPKDDEWQAALAEELA